MKSEAVEVIHYEITLQFLHHSMEENLNQCNDLKGGGEIWSSSGWRSETDTVTVQMVRLLVSCSNRFTPLAPGDAKSDWLLDKDSEQNLFLLVGCVGLFELVVVVISELKLCTSWLPRLSTYKLFGFGLWWHQWVILTLYRKFLTGHETVSV